MCAVQNYSLHCSTKSVCTDSSHVVVYKIAQYIKNIIHQRELDGSIFDAVNYYSMSLKYVSNNSVYLEEPFRKGLLFGEQNFIYVRVTVVMMTRYIGFV